MMTVISEVIRLAWREDVSCERDYLTANQEAESIVANSNNKLRLRNYNHIATKIKQIYDPLFPTYNANLVKGTSLIAAEGPSDLNLANQPCIGVTARFLENIVFNKNIKVGSILALGKPGVVDRGDFINYFKEGQYIFKVAAESTESYVVRSKKISIDCMSGINKYLLNISAPDGLNRVLELYWLCTPDLRPIKLFSEQSIALLYELYQVSRRSPIAIHCSAGVGRTGIIVLAFTLLNYYLEHPIDNIPKNNALIIRKWLNHIRTTRPAFISTCLQLASALDCTEKLNNYLKKKVAHEKH